MVVKLKHRNMLSNNTLAVHSIPLETLVFTNDRGKEANGEK